MPYFAPTLYTLGWVYTLSDVCFSERNVLIHGLDHTRVDLDVEVYGKCSSVCKILKNTIEVFYFCFRPPTLLKLTSFTDIFKDFAKVTFCHIFKTLFNVVKIILKKIFLIKYFMGSSINEVHKKWSIFRPLSSPAPCP